MEITLYNFTKRENSTLRPSGGDVYTGQLKEGCSILAPSVTFQFKTAPMYNYMYIPTFNRYYKISDWNYSGGLWTCSASVDVLASWRDAIGGSTQYILRSSAQKDGAIIDNMYPTKSTPQIRNIELETGWDIGGGSYVVGIIGKGGNGAVTYYAMTPAQFETFSGYLLGDTAYLGDLGDITVDAAKVQFNPFQYVTKVLWFPFEIGALATPTESVQIGWWDVAQPCGIVDIPYSTTLVVDLPQHPQASRGSFLNAAPYTRAALATPVFGMIPLDTSVLTGEFYIDIIVDFVTGESTLWLHKNNDVVSIHSGQVGVPVQLAQIAIDKIGVASSVFSGVMSLGMGNIAGGLSAIGNAVESAVPQMQTSGANGSKAAYTRRWKILVEHYILVDDNNEDRGSPLCQRRQISTIPGYIMVSDADIATNATADETGEIKSKMEGGFFFE